MVDAIEGGYVFEAKLHPSLSAIAGKIRSFAHQWLNTAITYKVEW